MDISELIKIKADAICEIAGAQTAGELAAVYKKYLDKEGVLGVFFRSMGALPAEQRGQAGVAANKLKQEIIATYEEKARELEDANRLENG